MKFWATKKFKELEEEWNRRLEEAGFEDAEYLIAGERKLRGDWHTKAAYNLRKGEEYYNLLGQKVWVSEFDCKADKIIMRHKAFGWKIKEISAVLEKKGLKSHRQTVRYVIRKYEDRWGIRKWKNLVTK